MNHPKTKTKGAHIGLSLMHKGIDRGAVVFAATISVVGVAATLVADRLIGQTYFFTSAGSLVALGASGILLAFVLYALAHRLYCAIDAHRCTPSQECFSLKALDRRFFLGVWAVILLCWLPWFIAYYPGNIDIDILFQMAQYYGLTNLTYHHPVITTFVFGALWRLGDLLGSHA